PYKIASALRGVVAQRLMRRLCRVCRRTTTQPVPDRAARFIPAGTTLYEAVGCGECAQTGYRGRFSIVEGLPKTGEIERLVGQGATADQIAAAARQGGMRSLWESGVRHVLAGESTLDELLRVTDVPVERAPPTSEPPVRGSRPGGRAAAAPAPSAAAPPAPASGFPTLDFMDLEL